jgi:hypothetical protein
MTVRSICSSQVRCWYAQVTVVALMVQEKLLQVLAYASNAYRVRMDVQVAFLLSYAL